MFTGETQARLNLPRALSFPEGPAAGTCRPPGWFCGSLTGRLIDCQEHPLGWEDTGQLPPGLPKATCQVSRSRCQVSGGALLPLAHRWTVKGKNGQDTPQGSS